MSASNIREARALVGVPSESGLKTHLEDCDKLKQTLDNDVPYLNVVQDRLADGFSFSKEEACHDATLESMATIANEEDQIRRFKTGIGNIKGVADHVSGTYCAIPSRTYEHGALFVMDWALLKVLGNRLESNGMQTYGPIPENFPRVNDDTLHSEGVCTPRKNTEVFKVGRTTG